MIEELRKKYDSENLYQVLVDYHTQISYALEHSYKVTEFPKKDFKNIIVCGLGGSAISADFMKNFSKNELQLPMTVWRNYGLPTFADENSLVICSSYSGNTEETIEALNAAIEKKCSIVTITTGGKVSQIAAQHNIPVVPLLPGFQPRFTLGMSFFALLHVMVQTGVLPEQSTMAHDAIELWKTKSVEYSSETGYVYKLAEQLNGFLPLAYSGADVNDSIGNRLKCQFNENSKLHCFVNVIPELNHNEIIGWEAHSDNTLKTKVLYLTDPEFHPQVQKRFDVLRGLIQKAGVEVITLESTQPTFKLRLLDMAYLMDWLSYFVAVQRGYDPAEIDYIHFLKKELAK